MSSNIELTQRLENKKKAIKLAIEHYERCCWSVKLLTAQYISKTRELKDFDQWAVKLNACRVVLDKAISECKDLEGQINKNGAK